MIRQILLALGIGAVLTGLASTANAQSSSSSSSDNSGVTLSGQSLRAVENRSAADDFQRFFSGTSQGGQYPEEGNVGRATQSPSGYSVSDRVDVMFGDTLNPDTPFTFPNSGEVGDTERVRVQLQVGE
jgi:hypothetical protein